MNYKVAIIVLAGIMAFSCNAALGAYSYKEVKGYDWLSKDEYKKYVDKWVDFLKSDSNLTSRIDTNRADSEAKYKKALKNPNNWTDNIGNNYFPLESNSEHTSVYQFKGAEFNKKSGDDHWVFFALPKSVKDNEFSDIYVYSDNEENRCHFKKNGHQGAYNYICPPEGKLCYVAVVTKEKGDPAWRCDDDKLDASSVYLSVKKDYLPSYEEPDNCETTGQYPTFTDPDGEHTHRIHPKKYRCSNNLCWSPSWKANMGVSDGNLNCWDADHWYEMKDGNPCERVTTRDRSMCEEVYNDAPGEDPGNGGGDPTDPPVTENPWIGYKSRAGIRYVRASKEGKKRWKNKLEVSLLDIYDMDFRANLKQKGGVWPEDTAASFYLSEDDVLDSGDILLGTDDRDLTRYQDRKKKSIYLEDIDMADYIDRPGDWYVFVVVTYEGGANQSSPGDDDEQVKITVLDPGLPDFITSNTKMGDRRGRRENYSWKINETAYVHAWIDNIGDIDWEGGQDHIKVPFYLSKGTKEDSHSQWLRIGREEIKKRNLKVRKRAKHESIKFDLAYWANQGKVLPDRTYNIVVCADRDKDQDNGDGYVREKHKSNNCSEEMVFFVEHGDPIDVDLITGNLVLTHGRSELQAGELYGLQVEVSNIGTDQPWNGFRTIYEIKGPGTGGAWQMVADDGSNADQLSPGATQFEEITDGHGARVPMVGGDYIFRACADYQQVVPETDEGNNCTELDVYIAPPPMPDLITHSLRLTHGRTSLTAGDLYGLEVGIQNIGDVRPGSGFRSSYHVKGPGTGSAWQFVADDGSDADELAPGATQWENITDGHGAHIPAVAGTYTARACADYQGHVPESDESNNCTEMTFDVAEAPVVQPRIVIKNPTHTDKWRSDSTAHDIRWEHYDFPAPNRVKIEYSLDGGASWLIIDDDTNNDKVKHWDDMCDFHTVDTDNAYIRITSLDYPGVVAVSGEFEIDHAKGCE